MPNTRKPYPPEFREQMVALVRTGRTPEDLAHEFEPTTQSISNWVAQADRDTSRRTDGLTTTARAELTQLRRENRQLKLVDTCGRVEWNVVLPGRGIGGNGHDILTMWPAAATRTPCLVESKKNGRTYENTSKVCRNAPGRAARPFTLATGRESLDSGMTWASTPMPSRAT